MNRTLGSLAALVIAAAIAVGTAGANGSPYSPGLVEGWDGVLAPGGKVRYVTLATSSSTVVAAIRTRDGRALRTRALRGYYGVPLVAYDGSSGGVSGDGKRLVVASYGPLPGSPGTTRMAVLDTKSLRIRRLVVLGGSWSFDAIAPDGSKLYLTEHVRAGRRPVYRVRSYDVATGLLRGAIVDRLENEEEMGGEPVTRASSPEGRWAYTLYARRNDEPFVHALDTSRREAYCIDLPLDLAFDRQWQLRMRLGDGSLAVRLGREHLATVDTRSWKVDAATG
jgi:hypothetical protein